MIAEETPFIFLRLNILRESLERELLMDGLPFEYSFEVNIKMQGFFFVKKGAKDLSYSQMNNMFGLMLYVPVNSYCHFGMVSSPNGKSHDWREKV